MADNTYTNISDLPTLDSVSSNTWAPVEISGKVGKKVDLAGLTEQSIENMDTTDDMTAEEKAAFLGNAYIPVKGADAVKNVAIGDVVPSAPGTLNTTNSSALATNASESLAGTIQLHKVAKTGRYTDLLSKPTIPSAPGKLNTNVTTGLPVSSNEALSGDIKLHKVSKTGSYNDLLDKPTIPASYVEDLWTHNGTHDTRYLTTNNSKVFPVDHIRQEALIFHIKRKHCYVTNADAVENTGTGGPYYYEDASKLISVCLFDGDSDYDTYSFNFYKSNNEAYPNKADFEKISDWTSARYVYAEDFDYFIDDYASLNQILAVLRAPEGVADATGIGTMQSLVIPIIPSQDETNEIELIMGYVPTEFVYAVEDPDSGRDHYRTYSEFLAELTMLSCASSRKKIDVSKPGYVRVTGNVFEIIQP